MSILKLNDICIEKVLIDSLSEMSNWGGTYYSGIFAFDSAGTEIASAKYNTNSERPECITIESPNKLVIDSNNATGIEFKVTNVGNGELSYFTIAHGQAIGNNAQSNPDHSNFDNIPLIHLTVATDNSADVKVDHTALQMNQTLTISGLKLTFPQEINV